MDKITELYNKLIELINSGDEKAARNFLVEHINDFPEDLRNKIILEFFKDALDQNLEYSEKKVKIQKEAMDSLKEIESEEKVLKDQKKINEVRTNLQNDSH